MFKVIAITKKNDYYRIGDDFNCSAWYKTKNVKDVEVHQGDLVEIEFEKEGKENILTSIKVVGKSEATSTSVSSSASSKSFTPYRSKSPEESESIRKQAVGKMVAETIKGFDGLNVTTVEMATSIIKTLFKTYDDLTK